jgi:hypothetical protein
MVIRDKPWFLVGCLFLGVIVFELTKFGMSPAIARDPLHWPIVILVTTYALIRGFVGTPATGSMGFRVLDLLKTVAVLVILIFATMSLLIHPGSSGPLHWSIALITWIILIAGMSGSKKSSQPAASH